MGKKVTLEEKHCYYGVLLGFLYAVGSHQAYVKMEINDEDGVYPVQKMMHDYGLKGRLEEEVHVSDKIQWKALENFNKWSQTVGFLPMNEEGMKKVLKFCKSEPRRQYLRNRVQKCFRTGELLSIADLIQIRLDVERKTAEKAKKKGGE